MKIERITVNEDGMNEGDAEELWSKIQAFASYSFNKSHSVEYSLISYQTMWLKTYHPLEFFAAAMTIAKSDKMPSLLRDAQRMGITVAPPDVNISTAEFEIADDKTLVAPLSALKGLSAKGTELIMADRAKNGPFKGVEDFRARLPARNVNKTVLANLEKVGAFAALTGDIPSTDTRRREDQLVLMPDVMLGGTIVSRELPRDKVVKELLTDAMSDAEKLSDPVFAVAPFILPRLGSRAKFMAVFDGPTTSDVGKGQFGKSRSFETVADFLDMYGLHVRDGYWTGLCKIPKIEGERIYSGAQIAANAPFLRRELELLKPQVVLTLGTAAMRFFEPKIKGGCQDNAGKIIYRKESEPGAGDDFNLVIGITPGMLHFDESRAPLLEQAIKTVAEMVL